MFFNPIGIAQWRYYTVLIATEDRFGFVGYPICGFVMALRLVLRVVGDSSMLRLNRDSVGLDFRP